MFELPQDWKFTTLRHVALPGRQAFTDGDWIEAPYISNSGIRLIQTGNIGSGEFLDKSNSQKFISKSTFQELACKWIRKGDVLVCRLADPIGRACKVPEELDCSITSVDVTILKVNEREFDPRYVLHWLNSKRNLKNAADRAGGSTRSRISRSNLGRLPIPHPPLQQQREIARILNTLDTQIRQTEALIAKLERIKQGLLTDLLTRGIDQNGQARPTPDQAPHLYKDSPLGRVPREWEVKSIAELPVAIIDGDRGVNYPSEGDFTEGEGYCLFLSAKNVTKEGFRFGSTQFITREKNKALGTGTVLRGDIVVTTRGTVGNFGFFDDTVVFPKIRINSGMLILRCRSKDLVSEYVYLALKERFFGIEQRKKGSGSAQPQLPAKDFKTFSLAIPSCDEQHRIAEAIKEYQTRIECERALLSKLNLEKGALMDDLLTGRVRVIPLLEAKERTTA